MATEWFVGPIMEKLINSCSEYIEDQFRWQKGLKKELERLRENQPKIQAVVFAAAEAHLIDQNPRLNKWIWQLRDAIDEADDVLDEFEYMKLKEQLARNTDETKLSELKSNAPASQHDEHTGRYWMLLGRKSSYHLWLLIQRERDLKEDKLITVASSSLLCITLLSIGKAYVSEPKSYIKTFLYYLGLGFSASGLSFVAGVMIHKFLDRLGLFDHDHPLPSPPPPPLIDLFRISSAGLSSSAARYC